MSNSALSFFYHDSFNFYKSEEKEYTTRTPKDEDKSSQSNTKDKENHIHLKLFNEACTERGNINGVITLYINNSLKRGAILLVFETTEIMKLPTLTKNRTIEKELQDFISQNKLIEQTIQKNSPHQKKVKRPIARLGRNRLSRYSTRGSLGARVPSKKTILHHQDGASPKFMQQQIQLALEKKQKKNYEKKESELSYKVDRYTVFSKEIVLFSFCEDFCSEDPITLVLPIKINLNKLIPCTRDYHSAFAEKIDLTRLSLNPNEKNYSTELMQVKNIVKVMYVPRGDLITAEEIPEYKDRLEIYQRDADFLEWARELYVRKSIGNRTVLFNLKPEGIVLPIKISKLCVFKSIIKAKCDVKLHKHHVSETYDQKIGFTFLFQRAITKKYRFLDVLIKSKLRCFRKDEQEKFLERISHLESFRLHSNETEKINSEKDDYDYELRAKVDLKKMKRPLETILTQHFSIDHYICYYLSESQMTFERKIHEEKIIFSSNKDDKFIGAKEGGFKQKFSKLQKKINRYPYASAMLPFVNLKLLLCEQRNWKLKVKRNSSEDSEEYQKLLA